jgi:hypothetical protein
MDMLRSYSGVLKMQHNKLENERKVPKIFHDWASQRFSRCFGGLFHETYVECCGVTGSRNKEGKKGVSVRLVQAQSRQQSGAVPS